MSVAFLPEGRLLFAWCYWRLLRRLAADIGGYLAWFYVQVGFPCTTASACIHAHHYVREQAGGYYRLLNLGTIYQT